MNKESIKSTIFQTQESIISELNDKIETSHSMVDVKEGDTVYVTRSDDNALKIQAHNPAVLEALAAAEVVMDENRTLLQSLA